MNYDLWLSITISILGGFLPMLVWLFFWLRHDAENPEPKRLILLTLFLGIAIAPLVIFFQTTIKFLTFIEDFEIHAFVNDNLWIGFILVTALAAVEEIFKYVAAYHGGLKKPDNDEAIDPIVYLITASLGFAAIENSLYVLSFFENGLEVAAAVSNVRFIGPTLVHVSSSAIIGVFIGLSYYKRNYGKKRYLITGFILAILLHSLFNFFIIRGGIYSSIAYSVVWFSIVVIITYFEKIKLRFKK